MRNSQDHYIIFLILSGALEGLRSPVTGRPGSAAGYALVGSTSAVECPIYDAVDLKEDKKVAEPGEADYSSDDSLDGLVDDLDFGPKVLLIF